MNEKLLGGLFMMILLGAGSITLWIAINRFLRWLDSVLDYRWSKPVESRYEPEPDSTPRRRFPDPWEAAFEDEDSRRRHPSSENRQNHPEGS